MSGGRMLRWLWWVVAVSGLLLSACQANSPRTARIYVSLPLQGPKMGASIWNGIKLAFDGIGNRVGDLDVELVVLDDGDASGQWLAGQEAANAQRAAADPLTLAYLGPMNSGAAKVSLPVLNRAGIAQINPSATWPGLTKPGYAQGEPGLFYPTGTRNFFRIVTTDEAQGPAAAQWAKSMGVVTYYILDDGEAYGSGIANLFESHAAQIALHKLGRQTIDKAATDYRRVLEQVKQADPDLVFFGGTVANGGGRLLKQLREMGITARFMGPDALMDSSLIEDAGAAAEGAMTTFVGVPPTQLTSAAGQKFLQEYRALYNTEPEAYAQLGYDAAQTIIAAMEETSRADRAGVLASLRNLTSLNGVNGVYGFDQNGDTTLRQVSGNVVENGTFKFEQVLMLP
jgi:branched-chain amino acid transport system substrate-binding protein